MVGVEKTLNNTPALRTNVTVADICIFSIKFPLRVEEYLANKKATLHRSSDSVLIRE